MIYRYDFSTLDQRIQLKYPRLQYKLYEAIFIHETYLCGFGFTFTDSRQEAWARVSNTDRASVEVYLKETDVHHCYTDKPANIEQCCVNQIIFFLIKEHIGLRSF